ncbi:class F sortase [Geodermatophilus sp. SYSU D00815]
MPDRARGKVRRTARPRAARAWAATSVLLALIGIGSIALAPQPLHPAEVVRLDSPRAVVPAPPTTSPTTPPAPTTADSPQAVHPAAAEEWPDVPPLAASPPVRVRIPGLGVSSAVVPLGLEADGSMELPPGAYPVGWYDRSPTPGQLGPAVLVGHVDWNGARGAFHGLRTLRPGDRIAVEREDGSTATFRVGRVERHPKDEFPTGEVYGDVGWSALRLITCGGSFDERTGDYSHNVVVFARLVGTG